MKRATARGRMVPQSLSTDPRMGRVSLKANLLFDRMWINCDDQGRISGDPDEIKYTACPNIDHITKPEIPELLNELDSQGLIKVYTTSLTKAVQMLDWWEEQKLQWAWPSRYPPPTGWQDRLRFKKSAKEVVTENWGSPENSPERPPENSPERPPERPPENSPERPPENSQISPLTTSIEKERGKRRGRGISPERSGERSPPPSLTTTEILNKLKQIYPYAFGKEPGARILAQLRDLATELSAAGCQLDYIDEAFKEAVGQNKFSVSYVRAILLDWLGVARGPPR